MSSESRWGERRRTKRRALLCGWRRRGSFQGTEQDVIWLDEEPPLDIYTECLLRTMTTGGLVMLTFTPLQGLSEVVLSFLPEGDLAKPVKFTVFCTWDEVPHLTQEAKEGLWKSIPSVPAGRP